MPYLMRGLIGYVSIETTKPSDWPRENLITNGDFEDVSNLPEEDRVLLLATEGEWTYFGGNPGEWPPGWSFEDPFKDEGGLQSMLWAPLAQPVQGRVSVWLGFVSGTYQTTWVHPIDQKVTSETIQDGQTYYLDFVGSINASAYNSGDLDWPVPDPNIIVELYWLKAGQDDIYTGAQGTDWDLILTLEQLADGSLGVMGGHWQTAQTSFTADSSLDGKSFFVRGYGEAPYVYFEEINLNKEPPPTIGAYTCYEQRDKFETLEYDLNGDCEIDFADIRLFVEQWLECNDPEGCS